MFTENIIQYFKTGNIGVCPVCEHPLSLEKIETPIRTSYTVSCNVCKKYVHFLGTLKTNQ